MNALGSLFFEELKEYEQAATWFKKAADKGFTIAINNLGVCYELGLGVDKNVDEAQKLYQEGADKNYLQATYNLAYLQFKIGQQTSESTNPHFSKAARLFRYCMMKIENNAK